LKVVDLYQDRPDLFSALMTRFWAKVEERGPNECWPWTGSRLPKGYGRARVELGPEGRETVIYSHRLAYLFCCGDIPEGLYVLHSCDNPPCCNARHLFLGTATDNAQDRESKGRGGGAHLRGEGNRRAKLTWESVREMREAYAAGDVTQAALATRYGVSSGTAFKVLAGHTWRAPSTHSEE